MMSNLQQTKKFKLGVIGCGARSEANIGSIGRVPELEIAALCDIVPHKMERRAVLIKNGPKPKFASNLGELLQIKELDAIVIITPNDTHRDIAVAALHAGLHVWVEKPLAMTVAECNDIIGAAERTGKIVQVGHQRRHSGANKALVKVVRDKPLGKILQSDIWGYRGDWRVPAEDEYPAGTAYWRLSQQRSGGVVYEMGAHQIDVNNWVFDSEPVSVYSLQGVNNFTLRKRDSSDYAGVFVRYANGAMMNYGANTYSYGAGAMDTYFFEKGTVQVGGGKVYIKYGSPPGFPIPADLPQPEEITLRDIDSSGGGESEQFSHFVKALQGTEKAFPDVNVGRQCVQVMEGSIRSAVERREINVGELG